MIWEVDLLSHWIVSLTSPYRLLILDSKTVLCWFRSNVNRFKAFIANRVGKIEELVGIVNWQWLSTKDNVTDDAKWDTQDVDLSPSSLWWTGPPFLSQPKKDWPMEDKRETSSIDGEILKVKIKTSHIHFMCVDQLLPDA